MIMNGWETYEVAFRPNLSAEEHFHAKEHDDRSKESRLKMEMKNEFVMQKSI